MSVSVSLFLFGKPEQMIDEPVSAQRLRDLRDQLNASLTASANALERMTADGWESEVALYDIVFTHPEVNTERQAIKRLKGLGLSAKDFRIDEHDDAEDEELAPHNWRDN